MKNKLLLFMLYCLLFGLTMAGVYCADQLLIPSDYKRIENCVYDREKEGYVFTVNEVDNTALILSNVNYFEVIQNGEKIYNSEAEHQEYSKMIVVPLLDSPNETTVVIRGSDNQTVIPGGNTKINMFLMSKDTASKLINRVSNWNHLFAGLILSVFFWSLSLFIFRMSEKYLLHIVISSFLNFLNLAVPLNLLGISASYSFNTYIRPIFLIICCLQFAYQIIYLYADHIPLKEKSALTPTLLILLIAIFCSVHLIAPKLYIYTFLRLLVCVPVVLVLGEAISHKKLGALLLLIASSVTVGITFYVFLLNKSQLQSGWITAFWRPTELSQGAMLLLTVFIVNYRLTVKLNLSEKLSTQLIEINNDLESKVEERTEMLHEQQKRKIAMMQNVFHDIRSPLFSIQEQINDMERQGQDVNEIKKRLEYMSNLVSNLFLLSKLEEGKELFDEDVVDINSIITDTAANYAFTAEEKGIELICECEKEAKVWGDEIKLQQMIQNLVINAVQHTSHGYVRISSSVADKKVQITVADTGEGIAEEDLQFVFERYYTSRKSRGSNSSGLGLAIAKEIAEAHNGEISVETARGSGSTFSVILPQL